MITMAPVILIMIRIILHALTDSIMLVRGGLITIHIITADGTLILVGAPMQEWAGDI